VIKLVTNTCAALALSAITFTSAHAAGVQIKVSDLNLSDPAQAQVLQGRISDAGRRMCANQRDLAQLSACEAGVRAEAMDELSRYQAASDLAKAEAAKKLTVAQR